METRNNSLIKVLNNLVEINNDRIEGYHRAAEETNESDLKTLFNKLASDSMKYKLELSNEIRRLGGDPDTGTTTAGKFFRSWMDLKAALTGHDRKAILSSCEFGEDNALDRYESALKDDDLVNTSQVSLVQQEYDALKKAHDNIRNMRDNIVH